MLYPTAPPLDHSAARWNWCSWQNCVWTKSWNSTQNRALGLFCVARGDGEFHRYCNHSLDWRYWKQFGRDKTHHGAPLFPASARSRKTVSAEGRLFSCSFNDFQFAAVRLQIMVDRHRLTRLWTFVFPWHQLSNVLTERSGINDPLAKIVTTYKSLFRGLPWIILVPISSSIGSLSLVQFYGFSSSAIASFFFHGRAWSKISCCSRQL